MSSYQLYRNTTLGHTLQESLDELIQMGQITPQLALKVLLQFDKAINHALANRVKNRIQFKGKLNTYRFCDNVWTFVLNTAEFKETQELAKVEKVKIVACDGKVIAEEFTGYNTQMILIRLAIPVYDRETVKRALNPNQTKLIARPQRLPEYLENLSYKKYKDKRGERNEEAWIKLRIGCFYHGFNIKSEASPTMTIKDTVLYKL